MFPVTKKLPRVRFWSWWRFALSKCPPVVKSDRSGEIKDTFVLYPNNSNRKEETYNFVKGV